MSQKSPTVIPCYIPEGAAKKKEIQDEAKSRGKKSASALLLEAYEEYLTNHPKGEK
jgi:hypothetical protein